MSSRGRWLRSLTSVSANDRGVALDFTITDDQRELVAAVRDVLAKECPADLVRAVVEGRDSGEGLWRQQVALGWPALVVPEEHGGLGLGTVELILLVTELGRVAAPGPLVPTLTQFLAAILEAGTPREQARWLPAIAEGTVTGALAVAEDGRWDVPPRLVATPQRDGFRLDGVKTHAVAGADTDELVVSASCADGIGLFVVPMRATVVTPVTSLDATRPLATLAFDSVEVSADRVLGVPGQCRAALRRTLEVATLATAAETTGACQALSDMTVAYAKVREQFGQPIGSFQAVKHALADVFVAIHKAQAVVQFAAMTLAEDDPRRARAVAMAKSAAGDAQRLSAAAAIQLQGGVAYTWEHDAHLFVKRAKAGDALFGTAALHRQRLARLLAEALPAPV